MSRKKPKPKESRKIAILGSAPSSVKLAPVDDLSWEIWACSPGSSEVPRIDQHFEFHRWEPGKDWFPPEYVEFLKTREGPVWMAVPIEEIPTCQKFPWEELVEMYGSYFFTSSIAWMMAMAIEMHPAEISLYGVDMASQSEYEAQKLGCQFFATIAVAKGIKVTAPPESIVLRPNPLYGMCESTQEWIKYTAMLGEYTERNASARVRSKDAEIQAAQWQLAIEAHAYYGMTWAGDMSSGDYTSPPLVPALKSGEDL